jgi:hypothetical protein
MTLGYFAIGWTMGLYNVKLKHVDELLDAVKVTAASQELKEFAKQLEELIQTYLRGVGHPDSNLICEMALEDFLKQHTNTLLYSHMFL